MPFPVHALDCRPLGSRFIREVTAPLCMITQEGHKEKISLYLIDSPAYSVVLGLPSLACHNPTVSWPQRALTWWSRECSGRCLGVSVGATTVESPDQVSTMCIPPEYADLALAFCKNKATQLPPHRWGGLCERSPGRRCISHESRVSPVVSRDSGYGDICL
jgi:hypothetical protein